MGEDSKDMHKTLKAVVLWLYPCLVNAPMLQDSQKELCPGPFRTASI